MLSVIIVNWNTCELLQSCLSSLRAFPPQAPYEVIVIDNASDDGSADMVKSRFPDCTLIESERNLGYAAGNNIGFTRAKGDLVLLLNPDTELFDESLTRCQSIFSTNQSVEVVGAKLLNKDGTIQRSIRKFPTPRNIFFEIVGLSRAFPTSRLFGDYRCSSMDYTVEQRVEQPMGTFLMLRSKTVHSVGLMDESFPIFFNEVDLLYRISRAGGVIHYSPEVQLYHIGGASTHQVRKPMIWESHRSLIRYLRKWHMKSVFAPLTVLLMGLIWAGAFVRARGWNAGFRP